jgi:hypothetical protein
MVVVCVAGGLGGKATKSAEESFLLVRNVGLGFGVAVEEWCNGRDAMPMLWKRKYLFRYLRVDVVWRGL